MWVHWGGIHGHGTDSEDSETDHQPVQTPGRSKACARTRARLQRPTPRAARAATPSQPDLQGRGPAAEQAAGWSPRQHRLAARNPATLPAPSLTSPPTHCHRPDPHTPKAGVPTWGRASPDPEHPPNRRSDCPPDKRGGRRRGWGRECAAPLWRGPKAQLTPGRPRPAWAIDRGLLFSGRKVWGAVGTPRWRVVSEQHANVPLADRASRQSRTALGRSRPKRNPHFVQELRCLDQASQLSRTALGRRLKVWDAVC